MVGDPAGVMTAFGELATNEVRPPLVTVPQNEPVPAFVMFLLPSITVVPLVAMDPLTSSFCVGVVAACFLIFTQPGSVYGQWTTNGNNINNNNSGNVGVGTT